MIVRCSFVPPPPPFLVPNVSLSRLSVVFARAVYCSYPRSEDVGPRWYDIPRPAYFSTGFDPGTAHIDVTRCSCTSTPCANTCKTKTQDSFNESASHNRKFPVIINPCSETNISFNHSDSKRCFATSELAQRPNTTTYSDWCAEQGLRRLILPLRLRRQTRKIRRSRHTGRHSRTNRFDGSLLNNWK